MDIDLRPVLDNESCGEATEESRKKCEEKLRTLFEKYGVSEDDGFTVANSILDYIQHAMDDTYDVALKGGAELGEMKGYKSAMDEAKMAAGQMALENIAKMSVGIGIDDNA